MNMIRSINELHPKKPNGKHIVYMHGYGGIIWFAKRQIKVLLAEGYMITAMDFRDILKRHSPEDLIRLMDEVAKVLESKNLIKESTVIVGISLGGLVGLNLLKRYTELNKLFVITGGDISRLPRAKTLKNKWHLTRAELGQKWNDVNMYNPIGVIKNKRITMLLPVRDKLIDPDEVRHEIERHSSLNTITLITTKGGHFRTIITETILFPKKSLPHITKLQ